MVAQCAAQRNPGPALTMLRGLEGVIFPWNYIYLAQILMAPSSAEQSWAPESHRKDLGWIDPCLFQHHASSCAPFVPASHVLHLS